MSESRRSASISPPTPSMAHGRNPRRSRPSRGILSPLGRFHEYRGALLLGLAVLVIWLNTTFLVPLLMGAIFAVVLHPLMKKLAHYRLNAVTRAGIITTGFAVAFLFPLGMIIVLGAEKALEQIKALQDSGFSASEMSPSGIIDYFGLGSIVDRISALSPVSQDQLRQVAGRALAGTGAWVVVVLQKVLAGLPAVMFSTFVIIITIFFLLIDGKKATAFIRENSFFGPEQTDRVFGVATQLCYSVVVASIAAGAVQAALIAIACVITGTKGAVLISLLAFVASFLPVIGTAPITLGLTAMSFLSGDVTSGFIFLAFVVIVGMSDNFVRPYVLKGGASLHPLVGFVAAFGALDVIGFYGVFIGPVVAGLFFALLPMVTRSFGRSPLH